MLSAGLSCIYFCLKYSAVLQILLGVLQNLYLAFNMIKFSVFEVYRANDF